MTQLELICQALAERAAWLAEVKPKRVRSGKRELRRLPDGRSHMVVFRSEQETLDDFLLNVRIVSLHECWEWQGAKGSYGHGQIRIQQKLWMCHRFLFEHVFGPIPAGLEVCHHCDNPPCVNPIHLFVGTHADNMQDAASKGRLPRGENQPTSKLSEEQVIEIRKAHAAGVPQKSLALSFGLCKAAVCFIVNRKRWQHLP